MRDQVDSTEYEAMTMVAAQVMSSHLAVTMCISKENSKFNILQPLLIKNILYSMQIMYDVCLCFINHVVVGIHNRSSHTGQQQPPAPASEEQFIRALAEHLKEYPPRR